jgi:hypothetical protein
VTLASEKQKAGYHQVQWDVSSYPSGVNYSLKAGGTDNPNFRGLFIIFFKVVILKFV